MLAQEDMGRMVDRSGAPPDPEPVEPAGGQISVEDFKRAAGSFITGVTVVTTRAPDGKLMGFTANSFTSVSLDPPLVLICLHRNAPSLHAFQSGGGFSVARHHRRAPDRRVHRTHRLLARGLLRRW